jgi:transcriptional regulator with XRE-family HTH domain
VPKPTNQLTKAIQLNLLRLFRWHALTNREAARLLGSTEHTVGDWLAGRREPGADYLLLIANLFAVDPRDLHGDPRTFGERVGDPQRIEAMDAKEWRERGYLLDEYGMAWARSVRAAKR